ncbi:hypothetical protein [Acetobacter senegalensis]|uniref:hypothetical protein n=1 Tax=Acetobacter senegalensis TaxID=446692 RepID=UPI002653501D|nr:hypothetical protein [Acetobacter senegalensis]MDN7356126.1 hypothetical protein [Acetobacter senegalensis]
MLHPFSLGTRSAAQRTRKGVDSQAATGSGKFTYHFGSDYKKTKAGKRITPCENDFSWKKEVLIASLFILCRPLDARFRKKQVRESEKAFFSHIKFKRLQSKRPDPDYHLP